MGLPVNAKILGDNIILFAAGGIFSVGCYWSYEILLAAWESHYSLGTLWGFAMLGVVGGIVKVVFK